MQWQEFVERPEHQPSYYYYKRWLWMQFPWSCMSLENQYS